MSAPESPQHELPLEDISNEAGQAGPATSDCPTAQPHGLAPPQPAERPGSSSSDRPSKPRVRFNSSAAQSPVMSVPKAKAKDRAAELLPPRTPRPALSRNPSSYNSVLDPGPDMPMSPAKAKSAEDAARRAQEAATAARHSSDDHELDEKDHWENTPEDSDQEKARTRQDDESRHKSESKMAARLWGAHQRRTAAEYENTRSRPLSQTDSVSSSERDSPRNPRGGVFYQLLKSYRNPSDSSNINDSSSTKIGTADSSGATTPTRRKWYNDPDKGSQETLSMLVGASRKLANPHETKNSLPEPKALRRRPGHKRTTSGRIMSSAEIREGDEHKIQMQIADILQRQRYITKMCRALLLFGAPGHRLEEHLRTTARWLEVDSQYLYVPDCMIISFDDNLTHTTRMKIVREVQGVNLAKLKATHEIYKEVLHDVIALDEALERLEHLVSAPVEWPAWLRIIMYGLASACISVSFSSRFIDIPVIFVLGTLLGFGQVWVVPKSRTFAVVFEVLATTVFAFAARGLGSIADGGLFCFSAMTQSSIALILPGVLVLNSALELQSKAIVPGSIRIVYAIIYSLFLGYGITVGATLYGYVDPHANLDSTCRNPANQYWGFLFVPLFILFATFINNAKLKQMPLMVLVGTVGYVVNFYTSKKFAESLPIAYALGAFTVGLLANAYSRFAHGVAATVLLPAVFVQVPGGLATSGAITAGLQTATALNDSDPNNSNDSQLNTIVFSLAANMIQISIGLSVGLSLANLVVYPLGKRRSALWSL